VVVTEPVNEPRLVWVDRIWGVWEVLISSDFLDTQAGKTCHIQPASLKDGVRSCRLVQLLKCSPFFLRRF